MLPNSNRSVRCFERFCLYKVPVNILRGLLRIHLLAGQILTTQRSKSMATKPGSETWMRAAAAYLAGCHRVTPGGDWAGCRPGRQTAGAGGCHRHLVQKALNCVGTREYANQRAPAAYPTVAWQGTQYTSRRHGRRDGTLSDTPPLSGSRRHNRWQQQTAFAGRISP